MQKLKKVRFQLTEMQKSAEAQERSKTPGSEGPPESVQKKVEGVGKRKPKPQMTKKTTAKQLQQEEQQPGASVQIAQPLLPWEPAATLLKPFGELEAIIDKRKRNLEKRKEKLQNYGRQLRDGNALAEDQMNAFHKLDDVKQQLEYLQVLKAAYLAGSEKLQQAINLQKKLEEMEFVKQIAIFMRYKEILAVLQDQEIRELFTMGTSGTVKLSAKELALLDALHPRICTALNLVPNIDVWHRMLQNAAEKVTDITFGSNNTVIGMHKGSDVKELLERISCCKFFQTIPEWLHDRFAAIRTSALARNGVNIHISRFRASGDSAGDYTPNSGFANGPVNGYAPNGRFANDRVNGLIPFGLVTKYMPINFLSNNKTSNSSDSSSNDASQASSSDADLKDQNKAQPEGARQDNRDSNPPNTSNSRPSYTYTKGSQKPNDYILFYNFYPVRFTSDVKVPSSLIRPLTRKF